MLEDGDKEDKRRKDSLPEDKLAAAERRSLQHRRQFWPLLMH